MVDSAADPKEKIGILLRLSDCFKDSDRDKSRKYLEQILKIEKTEPYVNYLLGKMLEDKKKIDEALKYYDISIENWKPKDDTADLNRAGISYMRSQLSKNDT